MTSEKTKQIRKEFVESILEDIINVPKYSSFCSHAYCKITHLGLRLKAEEENLFNKEDCSNPENKNEFIERIENFLAKYIR